MSRDGATCTGCGYYFSGMQIMQGDHNTTECSRSRLVGAGGGSGGGGGFGGGGWGGYTWFPDEPVTDRPGIGGPAVRVHGATIGDKPVPVICDRCADYGKAADAIMTLINSNPRSPTRDEIIATLKSI